jgi:chitinase
MRQLKSTTLLAASLIFLLTGTTGLKAEEAMSPFRLVGYFTAWGVYSSGYLVTDIPADKLTHINYAFFNISEDGECILGDEHADTQYSYPGDSADDTLRGNFKQLNLLKEAHPHLKTLMAVGGWTWSGRFSDAALTDESRTRFARSCIVLMTEYGFDGIDIDWEYPVGGGLPTNVTRPQDRQNFTLLLTELRAQLDTLGEADSRNYLLTIAAPAGPQTYANYELDKIHQHLDWINLMAYDFAGGWSATTAFHANLQPVFDTGLSAHRAVRDYLAAGTPPEKIILGVPFYGRAWQGASAQNNGLFQRYGDTYGEEGYLLYRNIVPLLPTLERFWHDDAQAAWLYGEADGVVISYDDEQTMRVKADYVQANQLGGMMIWELGGDDEQNSLLSVMYDALINPGS